MNYDSFLAGSKFTSTPAKVVDKPSMYTFLQNLLGISMSNKVLADIFIRDDPDYNTINIVGRPQVLGSASKQMRHVTPYAFMSNAIEGKIKEIVHDQSNRMTDFARDILYTLLPLNQGICLKNKDQYEKLKQNLNLEIESECFDIKMTTKDKQGESNVYYLISDNDALEECKLLEFDTIEASNDYNKKFHKYIMYGLNYLEEIIEVENNKNTLTFAFQGIVQLILTIFNQKPGICFATEGDSLQEELRLYDAPEEAKAAVKQKLIDQKYEVKSHKEIIETINANKEKFIGKNKKPLVRRVDNEGSIVKNAIEALHIMDALAAL